MYKKINENKIKNPEESTYPAAACKSGSYINTSSIKCMKPLMPAISPPSLNLATRLPRGQYSSKSANCKI